MKKQLFIFCLIIVQLYCCPDSVAQKLDIGTKQVLNQVNGQGMALSPDGSYLVCNRRYGPGIQVFRRDENGFKVAEVLGDYGTTGVFPQRFTVSHSGDLFLVANTDFTICLYKRNAQNGFDKIQTLTPLEDIVMFFAFSPDDKFLVAGDHNVLKWYSVGSELKEVKTFAFHGHPLFVGQQQIIIDAVMYSYTTNGELKQVQEMEEIKGASVDFDSPEAMAISDDGQYLAVNERGKIDLFKKKGTQFEWLQKVDAEEDFNAMAFSPDQAYLIAAEDNFIKTKLIVYQLKDDQLQMLTHEQGFQRGLESACFTPDGKLMMAATDEDLFLYPLKGIKGTKPLKKSAGPVVAKKEVTPEKKEIPVKPASNENRITIVWLNPNPDLLNDKPIVSDKPNFEIQIKIISDQPIDQKQLQIIINDKAESRQKFNEVSLKKSTNAEDGQTGYAYTFLKKIPLENGLNQIQLKAGEYISPTKAKIMYSGAKPNLHILAIGTSLDLQFPQKDAADFAALFNGQEGQNKLFAQVDIKKLIGKEATTNAIKEAIEFYKYGYKQGSISPNDVILVYISSHGFIYQDKFRIQGDDFKDMYKETYSVAYDEIVSRLNEVDCKKLIFLDACFSGGAKATPAEINEAIGELNKQHSGTSTFSSCSNDEYSYEDEKWGNGAFTKAILEACRDGKADLNKNQIITIEELYQYVKGRVPVMVEEIKHKAQHPVMPVNDLIRETPLYILE